jgi:hypothetical protein
MLATGTDGRKACESVGIWSPDGEYLPLPAPVVTEGRPEEWLNRVEAAMFAATKKHLFRALEDSKGGCALPLKCVCLGHGTPESQVCAHPPHTCMRHRGQEGEVAQGQPGADRHHSRPGCVDGRMRAGTG